MPKRPAFKLTDRVSPKFGPVSGGQKRPSLASAQSIGRLRDRQTPNYVSLPLSGGTNAVHCFHRSADPEHIPKSCTGLQAMLRLAVLAAAKSGTPPCYGLHVLRQTCTAWQLIPSAEGQSCAATSALHTMSSLGSDHKFPSSCLTQAGPSFGTSYCNLHIVRGIGSPAAAQVCILSAWASQPAFDHQNCPWIRLLSMYPCNGFLDICLDVNVLLQIMPCTYHSLLFDWCLALSFVASWCW